MRFNTRQVSVLTSAAFAVLLASLLPTVGCSSEAIDSSSFTATCTTLSEVSTAPSFDSLELRSKTVAATGTGAPAVYDAGAPADGGASGVGPGLPAPTFTVEATVGTACGNALDRSACEAKVATADVATSDWASDDAALGSGPYSPATRTVLRYFILTRGDDVRVLATRIDLAAAFGPIDSVAKAAQVLTPGARICRPSRTDGNGYSFYAETRNACGDVERQTVSSVSSTGNVTEESKLSGAKCDAPRPSSFGFMR